MAQLIIDIDDELIKEAGLEALKSDVEKILHFKQLHKVANKIENSILELGIEHNELWKESKKKAFSKFKEQHLKNIIP